MALRSLLVPKKSLHLFLGIVQLVVVNPLVEVMVERSKRENMRSLL